MVRLLSWNVNVRSRQRLLDQADAVATVQPDLAALQEVNLTTAARWRDLLREVGLTHSVSSLDLAADPTVLIGPRRTGVLTASRWPITSSAILADSPWLERVLTTTVDAPTGPLVLHNVYIPLGEHSGDVKVLTLDTLYATLSCYSDQHRLLCGDLNAPRAEYPDGRVLTWAQNEPTGSLRNPQRTRQGRHPHRAGATE